jgi:Rieske Fe-S protein
MQAGYSARTGRRSVATPSTTTPSADQLRCPCHLTSFSPAGQVITHALPLAPNPLPHFDVRERDGMIEVLAPPPPSQPA